VHIKDIGAAINGPENDLLAGWFNQQRAIILAVQRQPGANVIATVDRVKAMLPQLQASIPKDIKVSILSDGAKGRGFTGVKERVDVLLAEEKICSNHSPEVTGTIPATSQLERLISMTAISVPSGSRAVRDRLRSFNFCMGLLHRFTSATMECNILAAAP